MHGFERGVEFCDGAVAARGQGPEFGVGQLDERRSGRQVLAGAGDVGERPSPTGHLGRQVDEPRRVRTDELDGATEIHCPCKQASYAAVGDTGPRQLRHGCAGVRLMRVDTHDVDAFVLGDRCEVEHAGGAVRGVHQDVDHGVIIAVMSTAKPRLVSRRYANARAVVRGRTTRSKGYEVRPGRSGSERAGWPSLLAGGEPDKLAR